MRPERIAYRHDIDGTIAAFPQRPMPQRRQHAHPRILHQDERRVAVFGREQLTGIGQELLDQRTLAGQLEVHPVPLGAQVVQQARVEVVDGFRFPEALGVEPQIFRDDSRWQERAAQVERPRDGRGPAAVDTQHDHGSLANVLLRGRCAIARWSKGCAVTPLASERLKDRDGQAIAAARAKLGAQQQIAISGEVRTKRVGRGGITFQPSATSALA